MFILYNAYPNKYKKTSGGFYFIDVIQEAIIKLRTWAEMFIEMENNSSYLQHYSNDDYIKHKNNNATYI